ncbi:Zn finger [Haloarcula tailed virus 3]|uniref:Zn finger n=1 Tax=Haloarcula tailed virus 3 TaxID=2877990 RepID=A0AAE8Y059_9CAUD|nr:Zn finger [Haloarcula tailed virus 3]UBF23392.1 Zn finger [Haloarcula tailed virus 3]
MTNAWDKVDGISNRQPAYCPYCGESDGGFDGQGHTKKGYQHRCGECGQQFITILPETDA